MNRLSPAAVDAFVVHAPGRVNLIGEHTDYNDGFVLPMAIERGVTIAVTRRRDRLAAFRSEREAGAALLDLREALEPGRGDWVRYPAGVLAGYQRLGWEIPGFDAVITADLPAGGGLSSSRVRVGRGRTRLQLAPRGDPCDLVGGAPRALRSRAPPGHPRTLRKRPHLRIRRRARAGRLASRRTTHARQPCLAARCLRGLLP